MEPEVQEAPEVPRSELDTAFDVSRRRGWMVVPVVSSTPWGYVMWIDTRTDSGLVAAALVMSEDWERHPRDAARGN